MSSLYHEYLVDDRDFTDYEDFKKNCKLKTKQDFNFAYDIVDRYASDFPGKRALVWINDEGEEKTFTFDDISRESKRAAYWLVSKGIKKGDTVMLVLRRRYEWWILMPALHRIGAIVIPATDQLLQSDIEYRTNAADVKMIISYDNPIIQGEIEKSMPNSKTVQYLVTVGKEKRDGWISFHEEYEKAPAEFPRPVGEAATHNKDPMLLYFTSGTSGYPKMVLQDYDYPIGHIMTAKYWHGVVEDGLHLTIAETGWAKSTWGKLYGQWIAGTALFVYDMNMFKPAKMLEMISKYGLTTFCAPPTVYRYLVRQNLSKYDLSKCTRFSTAGEALNDEVYNKWLEQTGKKIYEGYGQTESTIICGNFLELSEIRPGSMGRPNPLYNVEILDANNKSVPAGEIGELCIHVENGRPFGLLMGYHKDVALTANAFDGGVYHTGDNVYMDEDGYVWFVGRKDDIIKTAGYRVSPFEVESILQKHPAVMECAVTGVEDPKRGMAVKATIVLSPGYDKKDPKEMEIELSTFAKENTAMYKCPRIFEFLPELPKTISGKIRRVEIRERDKGKDTDKIKQEF
ncbi:AMP-binding protein [Treponema porcinum]|uniref:AMP-binding protein n=2 Tax=Treponema porcinum TaxID=261392 RepID=UPI0023572BF5|nr:AMP-binding protein [Treponema porcinum]MCI5645049.1 AMP-binding protein [Treponema porcinum]MCI6481328.1 AMP-binding protein [Treponema porcinum]